MTWDVSIRDVIVEELRSDSLRKICARPDMPDRATVERWMAADQDFASRCAQAREYQADRIFDSMEELEDDVITGALKPDAAKVVLSSRQWRAEKIKPKVYGQKVAHDLSGSVNVIATSHDEAL